LIKFGTQDEHKCVNGRFVFFLNITKRKHVLLVGAKQFLYKPAFWLYDLVKFDMKILDVLLISWVLSNFIVIRVDVWLIFHGSKWNDIYVCILKPRDLYKCSIFTFLNSYNSKLQTFQLFVTTNIVLLAHNRSRSPLSHTNCTFPICTSLKSSTYLLAPYALVTFTSVQRKYFISHCKWELHIMNFPIINEVGSDMISALTKL